MDFMLWVWLGVIVLTAAIEFATLEMASIWFTVGAIVPLILSLIGGIHWAIQIVVFVVLSLVLIFSLRKVTKKYLLRNAKDKTNLDATIGGVYKLLTDVTDDNMGTIKLNGVVWNVVSKDGETINKGEKVEILKVQGSKFVVKKASTENKEDK